MAYINPYADAMYQRLKREHSKRLYRKGVIAANYPVPAIPLAVKYDYVGCVNIDDVTETDDPIIVYMWDSWTEQNV